MSAAYQQAPTNLYTGTLPDLNPEGGSFFEFVPPEDGWHELIFKIRYVDTPDGRQVPEVRPYVYQGQVKPNSYQIRLEFHLTDPDTEVTPWRNWLGWTIGENSNLRPILMAIRDNEPFPTGQRLNLDFLREHENRPFRALITVDETPSRRNPEQTMYFPNIVKCEPVGVAKSGRRTAKVAGREADATDKQLKFLDSLARAADVMGADLDALCQEVAGERLDGISRRGASAVIDRLKVLADEAETADKRDGDDEDDPFPDVPN